LQAYQFWNRLKLPNKVLYTCPYQSSFLCHINTLTGSGSCTTAFIFVTKNFQTLWFSTNRQSGLLEAMRLVGASNLYSFKVTCLHFYCIHLHSMSVSPDKQSHCMPVHYNCFVVQKVLASKQIFSCSSQSQPLATDTDPTIPLTLTTKIFLKNYFFTHRVRVAWGQMIFQNAFLAVAVVACSIILLMLW
jgi:hypothetical protein